MDEKQLIETIRQVVHEEVSGVREELEQLEQRQNKRFDTIEQAVFETSQDVKDIKSRLNATETDVRLLKKLASQ